RDTHTTQEEGAPAIHLSHDTCSAEENSGSRPGKADKDQTSHDGESEHASDDFDGRDDMAVKSLRIPVAITDSRKSLHTEKERVEVRAGRYSSNGFAAEGVELCKDQVDDDINGRNESGELWPG